METEQIETPTETPTVATTISEQYHMMMDVQQTTTTTTTSSSSSSSIPLNPPNSHLPPQPIVYNKKQTSCGQCPPCLTPNCGTCVHCLDMPKFGGQGKSRQRCKLRKCQNKVIKTKSTQPPPPPSSSLTSMINLQSSYPPLYDPTVSGGPSSNLGREYKCGLCGLPKKGHTCLFDSTQPKPLKPLKPLKPAKAEFNKQYTTMPAFINELVPPEKGEVQTVTLRLYRDPYENTFGFNPRICEYTHENTVKKGVLIEESYMDFQFATFWKQGRGESTRQFRLWAGDVVVGINGNDIEEVVGEDLKGFEGFFRSEYVDLTVFRGCESTIKRRYDVNPIYGIPYYDCDSSDEELSEGGVEITRIEDAREWLKNRKEVWRERRGGGYEEGGEVGERFWEEEDKSSFEEWYSCAKEDWENNYSWNRKTRKALIARYDKGGVTLGREGFDQWLAIRKIGWQVDRIKRKKKRKLEEPAVGTTTASLLHEMTALTHVSNPILKDIVNFSTELQRTSTITNHVYSLDWIFDVNRNSNDDVVFYFMTFLTQFDLLKLCMLSRSTRSQIEERENIWKMKCKSHRRWNLPSRPRKGWFDLYFTKFKTSTLLTRRNSDALLIRFAALLDRGDALSQIQKLVKQSEADWDFDINYTSGSVLDRNGLLNYAVIKKRKNCVKWLVDSKNAWIETADAGGFTPLLNAVYNNDLYFVRYFLSRGSNRNAIGITHSSQGFKAGFEGLKAEQWARKKGFEEVANEIKYGVSKFVR
ncbi:hypothetical protein TrVE_jg4441 [Triparma verrucosa]|uniref:CXXC-type domain-containing protein n=1 Tax=Triparma verrucosa TaxID=1606542 RepID=A0A9W7EPK4_9STRA|nr:hypothetical protein TrVE_jg4441 [Triparma verrucosa]